MKLPKMIFWIVVAILLAGLATILFAFFVKAI
jgi:hypothetical protein